MAAQPEQPPKRRISVTEDTSHLRHSLGRVSIFSHHSGAPLDGPLGGEQQKPRATLIDMFMSGLTAADLVADDLLSEAVGHEQPDVDVRFFPDPPCIMPLEKSSSKETSMKGEPPQSYFKGHATWRLEDQHVRTARLRGKAFVDLWTARQGLGVSSRRSSSRSPGGVEAFVNISPQAVALRARDSPEDDAMTGEVVLPGECIVVDEVSEVDEVRFLKLADGRGWVFDSIGMESVMAKMEEVETGASWHRVTCRRVVDVRVAPLYDAEARTGRLLCPDELVVVSIKARVRGQHFAHLSDGRGWVFLVQQEQGADEKKRRLAKWVLEECEDEVTLGLRNRDAAEMIIPTNTVIEVGMWTYVVGLEAVLAVGAGLTGAWIEPGDVVKVNKRAFSDGVPLDSGGDGRRWLRLVDGRGWVPEKDPDGKDLLTLRTQTSMSYPAHFDAARNTQRSSEPWKYGIM